MIRFGGPIIPTFESTGYDADAYATLHEQKGFRAAYVPSGLKTTDAHAIRDLRRSFHKRGIVFAELGIFNNMLDTDLTSRNANREEVMQGLYLAELMQVRCFVAILGTFAHGRCRDAHVAQNFSSDAFDAAVELARYFIDNVDPKHTYFAFESFPFNVIDSPEAIVRLVEAVDRERFGVHLDLVNLINSPRKYFANADLMKQCMKLFGNKIVSAHAKDIRVCVPSISVMFEEVIPGQGNLDMAAYLTGLDRLPYEVPLMLEHLETEGDYDQAADYIRFTASRLNIAL